ncbi:hypothetical protein BD779DRAFT_1669763 [Infundibulicybe gibba]|nr:hypothetical protein BD779DRAFT_1669763 [Infundibulicybe gibba]
MKTTVVFSVLLATFSAARPSTDVTPRDSCGDLNNAVPLLRGYSSSRGKHVYTIDPDEMNTLVASGYVAEPSAGRIWADMQPGTVPFFRLFDNATFDSIYTTSTSEAIDSVNQGYTALGVVGFLFPSSQCGAIQLFRTFSPGGVDHFYTTNPAEQSRAVTSLGYTDQGVAGFVLP